MSFSYNTTSPGSRDKLRLLVADTNSLTYVFEDEEMDMFLSLLDDVMLSAAMALRTLAVDKSKLSVYYALNGFTMDRRDVAKRLIELADKIEESAEGAPFEFESALEYVVDSFGQDRSNYMDTLP